MKKFGLKPLRGRRKPRKSKCNDKFAPSPNLLVSLFPLYKNHVWVTDFTYIKWHDRFVYLATVIDLFTREVLGISIKTNHTALGCAPKTFAEKIARQYEIKYNMSQEKQVVQ